MVIDQINIVSIAFMESEDDAPVRSDGYAPKALKITFQGVEMKTGQVHVFRLSGKVQDGQNILDLLEVIGRMPLVCPFSNSRLRPLCLNPRIMCHPTNDKWPLSTVFYE